MKSINLNDRIKVKLTPKGVDIFYHQHDELNKWLKSVNSLLIEPCVPSCWNEVSVYKIYQNAKYDIKLIRSNKNEITLDGQVLEGNTVPVIDDGKIHQVICYFK